MDSYTLFYSKYRACVYMEVYIVLLKTTPLCFFKVYGKILNMRRHFKRLTILSFIFVVAAALAALSSTDVYALDPSMHPLCQSEEILWDKFVHTYPALDLRRTTGSIMIYGVSGGPMTFATGKDTNTAGKCAAQLMDENGASIGCEIDPSECDDIDQVPQLQNVNGTTTYNFEEYGKSSTSGSLLGLANFVQGIVINEPVPDNLAFFWND